MAEFPNEMRANSGSDDQKRHNQDQGIYPGNFRDHDPFPAHPSTARGAAADKKMIETCPAGNDAGPLTERLLMIKE